LASFACDMSSQRNLNLPGRSVNVQVYVMGIILAFALATAVCFVSNNLNARLHHRDEVVSQQLALLSRSPLIFDGRPSDLPELRNRILFPAVMVSLAHVSGLNDREAFLALRWLTATGCFLLLWWFSLSVAHTDIPIAILAAAVLALFFVLSFNHPWEHPTDFPDASMIILATWAAHKRRIWVALLLTLVGAANRESAAFAGVIWVAVTAFDMATPAWRSIARGAGLALAAMAMTTALRLAWGLPGSRTTNSLFGGDNDIPRMVNVAVTHPFMSWAMMLVASLIPIGVLAAFYWRSYVAEGRRIMIAGFLIGLGSLLIGSPDEIRILIPCVTTLVCGMCLLAGDCGRTKDSEPIKSFAQSNVSTSRQAIGR